MRYLFGSIADWNALFQQAYRACKSGGWVESVEASPRMKSDDGTVKSDSSIYKWGEIFVEGGKKLGQTCEAIEDDIQAKSLIAAGFVDVNVHNIKVPVGSWPKDPKFREIGQYAQKTAELDYEGYITSMANLVLGWDRNGVLVYCAHLRNEIACGKYHPWFTLRVVCGRKPE
jgi:hypothetical protein